MHQAVYSTFGWRFDVNQPVVGADFKVLTRIFVNEGTTEHAEPADTRREWDGTRNLGTGTFDRINDFSCRRV